VNCSRSSMSAVIPEQTRTRAGLRPWRTCACCAGAAAAFTATMSCHWLSAVAASKERTLTPALLPPATLSPSAAASACLQPQLSAAQAIASYNELLRPYLERGLTEVEGT
jgi:hypothetical protein